MGGRGGGEGVMGEGEDVGNKVNDHCHQGGSSCSPPSAQGTSPMPRVYHHGHVF